MSSKGASSKVGSGRICVVGVGASAGGLHALRELFESLPADTGACFVVLQHLSPDDPSFTPEIIAGETTLCVSLAEDGKPVEPDEIVFLPPGASLRLEEARFRLEARQDRELTSSVIDRFFISLAEDQGPAAVGVLLSGAGSDGTIGLQAIREHGGHTLVQEPETAEFDGMPWSAIRAGVADRVEPIPELAAALTDLLARKHPLRRSPEHAPAMDETPEHLLRRITVLLRRHTGHDFSAYKPGTLTRRLGRRLQLRGTRDLRDYVEQLERDSGEAEALFRDMMIGVTQFFRDPEAWSELERHVIPGLLGGGNGPEGEVRVWVPGCTTGEEVYSLAILLAEAERRPGAAEVKIFGTDIDDHALAFAREGLYPDGIASSMSPERLDRFFEREDDHYRIARRLRERCIFAPHNLLSDPPFSRLRLISCRNLLIYLAAEAQDRALGVFQYGLRPGGYLFLGSSESLTGRREMFETVDKSHRIFRRTEVPGPAPTGLLDELPVTRVRTERGRQRRATGRWIAGQDLRSRTERILVQSEGPATVLVDGDQEVVHFFGRTGRFLEPSAAGGGSNVVDMALPGLRPMLRAALREARREQRRVTRRGVKADGGGESFLVDITVRPTTELGGDGDFLLVIFRERGIVDPDAATDGDATAEGDATAATELEAELRETREHLQATIEELESSNEELQSANEELLSMNEELQTSKEEAQSINEELKTVNAELKNKIQKLDEAHADLHNLFRSTQIATIFLDKQARIQRFTPPTAELFRLREADVGRPIADITQRFSDGDLQAHIARVLEHLAPVHLDVRTQEDDRWYTLRIFPYRTVDDVIEGVVLTFADITELKHATTRLLSEREYARSVVESVRDPIVVLDAELRVLFVNRAFSEAFGVSPGEVENQAFPTFAGGRWIDDDLGEDLARSAAQGSAIVGRDVNVRHAEQGERRMRLNARPVLAPGAEGTERLLVILSDVTEQRDREDAHREESQRKDWFLAMLGHEIRNPLAPIHTGIELLRRPDLAEGRREGVLDMMGRQVDHLRQLVDDLLDIARINSGAIPLKREPVDLVELTREVTEDQRGQSEAGDLALDVSLPEGELMTIGDGVRLRQALDNLLSNSRKYTPAGGRVSVRLRRLAEDEASLTVADTGIGMDPDMLVHAFDQFHQGPRGPGDSDKGLGLGLTLVRLVVEAHGGTATVHSEGPGEGTRVELRLPLAGPRDLAETELGSSDRVVSGDGSARAATDGGAGRRILIVEDYSDAAETTRLLLESRGHEVVVAGDGEEAIRRARDFRPDVIVCDLGLPGRLNGHDVARAIRDDEALASTRLVALTGYGQASDRERGLSSGFDAFLVKPVTGSDLSEAVG